MVHKAKLGPAFRKLPRKSIVTRGKGRTLSRQPKPFTQGVGSQRQPSSFELFNVGKVSEIPSGTLPETSPSTREGTRLLTRSKKRRTKVG